MLSKQDKINLINDRISMHKSMLKKLNYNKENFYNIDRSSGLNRLNLEGIAEEIDRCSRVISALEAYKLTIDE